MVFKTLISLIISLSLTTVSPADAIASGLEKETRLTLYLREIDYGRHATVVIYPPHDNATSDLGTTYVADNELRDGPDPKSRLLGRAEGHRADASLAGPAYILGTNYVFTAGRYEGSIINAFGRSVTSAGTMYVLNVIGGTGAFEGARGNVFGEVLGSPPGVLLVKLNISVVYYEDVVTLVYM